MKTSIIEVHEMLSVLGVEEVETRIGKVPGVESVTVNYAAKSATVRYDETKLEVSDIKSGVRHQSEDKSSVSAPAASAGKGHEGHAVPVASPVTPVPDASSTTPKPSSPTPAAGNAGDKQSNKAVPEKS